MRFSFLLAVLAAGPAFGECPTRSALDSGEPAYAAYPDGSIVDFILKPDGSVQETTRYGDHTHEFRMLSQGGVFIVDEVDLDGDRELPASRITSTYSKDLDAFLPLAPDQSFSLIAVNSFADGTPDEEERLELRSGGIAEIDVAGCPYTGFPILLTYRWANEYFTSMMVHLPDLGLSLELARMDQGDEARPFAPIHFSLQHP